MALAERRTLAIEAKLRDLLTGPLTKMERSLSRFQVVAGRALGVASVAVAGLVATATVGFRQFLKIADGLDAIAKASENLNITAESLTAIRGGAELAGVSIDELGTAMKAFQKVVDEANEGNERQRELLDRVGIVASEFVDEQLDVVDVLSKVADGLGNVESAAARTALTVALFGRSGQQLGALLREGSSGIQRMADDATRLGFVFTKEELDRVQKFNDAWDQLGQTFRGIAERIVVDLSPAFTRFFETLQTLLADKSQAIAERMFQFTLIMVDTIETIVKLLGWVERVAAGFQFWLQTMDAMQLGIRTLLPKVTGNTAELERLETQLANAGVRVQQTVALMTELANRTDITGDAFKKLREDLSAFRRGGLPPEVDPSAATPGAKKAAVPDKDVWKDYFEGFEKGANKAIETWQDFEKAGVEAATLIIDGGLDGLTDAVASIIDNTKSAKEAFADFARGVLADLAKIIAKLLVMEGLNLVLGLEKGGVVPAMAKGGIRRYAGGGVNRNGGVATGPTVLFGEGSRNEAFVPLPDNRSIPVSFVDGAPTGGSNVNIYITAMDSRDVQRVLVDEKETLRAIWTNQIETEVGVRRTMQRGVR